MKKQLFNRELMFNWLESQGQQTWVDSLRLSCSQRLNALANENMKRWAKALTALPDCQDSRVLVRGDHVVVEGTFSESLEQTRETLLALHPWRKGPFRFNGIEIDTEWRSNWKWDRIAHAVNFQNASVIDVGCGNGYYGWRMLDVGARSVFGCDPFGLYLCQFEVARKYASPKQPHWIAPIGDTEIPEQLETFDIALSMGVLYHRTSPIDHLKTMCGTLRSGGTIILETLVLDGTQESALVPESRYAKMRNVWFIPTVPMLIRWLRRTGFIECEVIDVTPTTIEEQRRTDWMKFESLADFLAPDNSHRTIEGYPGPIRAIIRAVKR
ncbi:MAG: tRNA 5-methoxyuridine(34)/uridine 5-oxyacetic acid(34) synthase CmoB [Pirellulaceae bacterium]